MLLWFNNDDEVKKKKKKKKKKCMQCVCVSNSVTPLSVVVVPSSLVYIQDTLYLTVQGWSLHLRVMVEASESMNVRGGGVRSAVDA